MPKAITLRHYKLILKTREYVNKFKYFPCVDCGVQYPPMAMDFDHISDNKKLNISVMVIQCASKARIRREMAKCELVCSNCHRVRTFRRLHHTLEYYRVLKKAGLSTKQLRVAPKKSKAV